MKKLILLLLFTAISFAQNPTKNVAGFYAGSSTMNASAIGQFDSTSKGFLFPRMTTTQRNAISSPATSLIIFNTTTGVYNFYNGASWVEIPDPEILEYANYAAFPATGISGKIYINLEQNTLYHWADSQYKTLSRQTLQNVLDFNHNLTNGNNYQGTGAGSSSTGTFNLYLGHNAGNGTGAGNYNIDLGTNSGAGVTTNENVFIGSSAGENSTGSSNNVGIGSLALSESTGTYGIAIGAAAGYQNTGNNLTAYGQNAAHNQSGNNVIAIGPSAAVDYSSGSIPADANTFDNVILLGPYAFADGDSQYVFSKDDTTYHRNDISGFTATRKTTWPDDDGMVVYSVNGNTPDSAGNVTISGGSGTVTSITASSPLTGGTITTSGSIGIQDAAADNTTKGAATFFPADFNSSGGAISLDYTNGQSASGSTKGYLTSTDWTTFNNKQSTITGQALAKTDDTNVTITLGGTPSTALLEPVSLTVGWTGTLADGRIASASNWNTAYTNRITSATTPLSISSNTVAIQVANTSQNGYLSSTDWNTFNGKQASLTASNFGSFSSGLTGKTTPVDADTFNLSDSAASGDAKKVTLTNFWANYLKAKADTNYVPKTTSTTGAVISFAVPQIYNTYSSPSSSNITDDLTGAQIGVIQKIYHNNSSAPTFPAGWVRLGSQTYTTSTLNIIYAEWVSGTRVEYWITK